MELTHERFFVRGCGEFCEKNKKAWMFRDAEVLGRLGVLLHPRGFKWRSRFDVRGVFGYDVSPRTSSSFWIFLLFRVPSRVGAC